MSKNARQVEQEGMSDLDKKINEVDPNFWWQLGVPEEFIDLYCEVVADRARLQKTAEAYLELEEIYRADLETRERFYKELKNE